MSSPRIAIIGGSGLMGAALAETLQTRPVVVIDRRAPARLGISAEYRPCDILDQSALRASLLGCEVVFHKAALLGGARSRDPEQITEYLEKNVRGTLNVLEACSAAGVRRLVFDSSKEVFGTDDQAFRARETASAVPRNYYGASKLIAEAAVAAHHRRHGLECIILRYSRVRHRRSPDVITRFCDAVVGGAPIILTSSPEKSLDFVDLTDAVAANLLALSCSQTFGVFHVSCGESMQLGEIAREVVALAGKSRHPILLRPTLGPDFEPLRNELDITSTRAVLGFVPRVTMREMIRSSFAAVSATASARAE